MSDIKTMAEVAPLLEKGTLPSEAQAADRRQKSAHKSLMSMLLIAFILWYVPPSTLPQVKTLTTRSSTVPSISPWDTSR